MTQVVSPSSVQNVRAAPETRRELRKKRIVQLVFVIYWLLVLEGALRKWVTPHFSRELFFIRDPFVLWVYGLALIGHLRPQKSIFLVVGMVFSVVCLPLAVLQYASSPYIQSWLLSGYGWRNYFFYLPLAFLIAKYFSAQDFERLMRWTLILAIPVGLLVYVQSRSPAFAPINQGIGTGSEEVYGNGGVAGSVVRTYGTFTSSPGQGAFIGSVVAMLLTAWLRSRAKRPLRGMLLVAATAGGATCLAVSGSRGAIVQAGIIFVASIVATLLASGSSLALQKLLIPVIFLAAGIMLAPIVFPQAVDALMARFQRASYTEVNNYGSSGILGRAVYEMGSFRYLLASTPPQGYQLGLGGNAGGVIGQKRSAGSNYYDPRLIPFGKIEIAAVESDWGRNIVELGPTLGLLFIVFRVAFVIWLAKEAIVATIRSNDPLPLLLFAFVGVYLFNGQITGHGTLNGYGWLFAGFCMSINRSSAGGRVAARSRSSRRFEMIGRAGNVVGLGPQIARP
jgi:hypothetical protein